MVTARRQLRSDSRDGQANSGGAVDYSSRGRALAKMKHTNTVFAFLAHRVARRPRYRPNAFERGTRETVRPILPVEASDLTILPFDTLDAGLFIDENCRQPPCKPN